MKNYKSVLLLDPAYPQNLTTITNPPNLLYYQGKLLKKDQKAIAIVGTRKPTNYGIKTTKLFTQYLVKAGFTIISGLALGIDTIAHTEALKQKGRTIAVLGSGLDQIYPKQNTTLFNQIIRSGTVLSEFPSGTAPLAKHFLFRNRLISGLSIGVLIIEGAVKSGTLSTATHAANQNREVFAIPGPIDSPMSEAPNYLIKQGAWLVTSPKDILDIIV